MLLRHALERYTFLFLLGNVSSHSVYVHDVLPVSNMNKRVGGQQAYLRDGWFYDGSKVHSIVIQSIGGCCVRRLLSLQPDFI